MREQRWRADAERDFQDANHWNAVIRAIEKLAGFSHQLDTAMWMLHR